MLVLRVIWLVFFVVNLAIVAYEVRIESRHEVLASMRPWYALPLRVFLSLFGPIYIAIQFGALSGGNAARAALFDLLEKTEHCPLCGACRHTEQNLEAQALRDKIEAK